MAIELEDLCELRLLPIEPPPSVRPGGGLAGSSYERGAGSVKGSRLTGTLKYSQHTRTGADGRGHIRLDALLTTAAGQLVSMHAEGPATADGNGVLTVTFVAQDVAFTWLNEVIGHGRLSDSPEGDRAISVQA